MTGTNEYVQSTHNYDWFNPDPDESHQLVLALVGSARRVLDVGCATGMLTAAIQGHGATVVGVEPSPAAAAIGRAKGLDIRCGVVSSALRTDEGGSFDCVVLSDVIEHVTSADELLRQCAQFLRPDGFYVISVPNVAHWSVRVDLVRGRFEYAEYGLLDRTHVHMYTERTLTELLTRCGLTPSDRRATLGLWALPQWRLAAGIRRRLLRAGADRWPSLFAMQFVWRVERNPRVGTGIGSTETRVTA